MIEIADVSLKRGKLQLFDQFSLTLPDPGIYLLSGPTGSGKSMLCSMIAGRVRPDDGKIAIDGSPPRKGLAGHSSDFYSEAGAANSFKESAREYLVAELAAAGINSRTAADYFGLLASYLPGGIEVSAAALSSGEFLILQATLAAASPGRIAILDGHLNNLSEDAAVYCWQILQSSLVEHEKFIILTANGSHAYLEGDSTLIQLAGGLPIRVKV